MQFVFKGFFRATMIYLEIYMYIQFFTKWAGSLPIKWYNVTLKYFVFCFLGKGCWVCFVFVSIIVGGDTGDFPPSCPWWDLSMTHPPTQVSYISWWGRGGVGGVVSVQQLGGQSFFASVLACAVIKGINPKNSHLFCEVWVRGGVNS